MEKRIALQINGGRSDETGMRITVGVVDDSPLPNGEAFRRFDFSRQAEISVDLYHYGAFSEDAVTVSQSSVGFTNLKQANEIVAVFAKAVQIGELIESFFEAGENVPAIAAALQHVDVLADLDIEAL